MKYMVLFNGKFLASRKSVDACVNYINRRGLADDESNDCHIYSENGNYYDVNGNLECL